MPPDIPLCSALVACITAFVMITVLNWDVLEKVEKFPSIAQVR
ncbi:hypothetical protein SLEP1_g20202 [Rubroshorea leprosula]|uniref:Uncharacterized protein n=1 Tax=Rubroshorea leprosula TaxID=152421 RepID=A0AAV5JDV5_9ROSI|nr:hypothetical protein SLEP1_g20202 [Rubroshorea leprosula]